jgi:hypothetical protein
MDWGIYTRCGKESHNISCLAADLHGVEAGRPAHWLSRFTYAPLYWLTLVPFERVVCLFNPEEDSSMKRLLLSVPLFCCGSAACSATDFQTPVRMKADGVAVRVESPGYAAPCWADIDSDGNKDLLVGQFNDGKIRVFKNLGAEDLAAGDWLQAGGKVAEVPGVW